MKAMFSQLEKVNEAGEFKRVAKNGKEIWIQASYNPILDPSGRPFKVVKYASDITAAKQHAADGKETSDGVPATFFGHPHPIKSIPLGFCR